MKKEYDEWRDDFDYFIVYDRYSYLTTDYHWIAIAAFRDTLDPKQLYMLRGDDIQACYAADYIERNKDFYYRGEGSNATFAMLELTKVMEKACNKENKK